MGPGFILSPQRAAVTVRNFSLFLAQVPHFMASGPVGRPMSCDNISRSPEKNGVHSALCSNVTFNQAWETSEISLPG